MEHHGEHLGGQSARSGLVDFVFVGPDKSGSTWLDQQMRAHPSIDLPVLKELFYFDRYFERGDDWYAEQFPPRRGCVVRGELSHDYMFSAEAIDRLHVAAPHAVLLCCLRDPIDRAYSSFRFMQYQGRIASTMDFGTALTAVDELLGHGAYGRHLTTLTSRYPIESIHVGMFDDLRSDPQAYFDAICDRLGVEHLVLGDAARSAVLPARAARRPAINRALRSFGWRLRDLGLESLVSWAKASKLVAKITQSDTKLERPDLDAIRRSAPAWLIEDLLLAESITGLALLTMWGYS